MVVLAALVLAASSVSIHGGTPFERRALKEAITEVPACLRDAGEGPVQVKIIASDENNAYFDFDKETVEVNEAAIPGTALYEQALQDDAAYACTSVRRMRRFGNLDATLLHEFVHHFQFDGEHVDPATHRAVANDFLVDGFLRLKFDKKRARARRDRRIRELYRLLNNLDAIPDWSDDEQNRFCRWQDELDRRIAARGFPVRYPGDGPYTLDDASGGEYFAEAVETWAYFPDVFCRTYEPSEQQWLVENLGSCLSRTGRKPACIAGGRSHRPESVSRRTTRGR